MTGLMRDVKQGVAKHMAAIIFVRLYLYTEVFCDGADAHDNVS